MFLINIYVLRLELNYDCYLHLNERRNNYFTFNVFCILLFPSANYSYTPTSASSIQNSHSNYVKLSWCFFFCIFTFPFSGSSSSLCLASDSTICDWAREKEGGTEKERQNEQRAGRASLIQILEISGKEKKIAIAHYNNEPQAK